MATRKKAKGEQVVAADTEVHTPLSVALTELQRFKLEALELRTAALVNPVKEGLVRKYQELLRAELEHVIATDANIVAAKSAQNSYVNEVLAEVEAQLPEGYAVLMLSHETGNAEAVYNPGQRGLRLPTG